VASEHIFEEIHALEKNTMKLKRHGKVTAYGDQGLRLGHQIALVLTLGPVF
jgi:hypothetical protein